MSFLSSFNPSGSNFALQMILFLAVATLFGILIGWFLGRLGRQKKIGQMETEWRNTMDDVEDDHRRVVNRFRKSNQDLDEENTSLKTKIATLNSRIDGSRDELAKVQSGADAQTARINQLEQNARALESQLAEEQAKNAKLQTLLKALKTATDEKDVQIRQLGFDLDDARTRVDSSALQNNEEFISLQKENSEMRSAIRENADLQQRIATEGREKEEALAELYAIRQRLSSIERERDEYRSWTRRLEQEKAGFDERVDGAVAEALQNSGASASELELEVARLRPMVTQMNSELSRLRDENDRLTTVQRDADQTRQPVSDNNRLHTQLRDVSYERDQLRIKAADFERQIASLNSRLRGSSSPEVARLRKELAELSAEKGFMSAMIEELQQGQGVI